MDDELRRQPPDRACMIVTSSVGSTAVVEVADRLVVDEHLHVLAQPALLVDHAEADARGTAGRGRRGPRRRSSARRRRPPACSVYERSGVGMRTFTVRSTGSAYSTE